MPNPKKDQLCCDKRTLVALAGEGRGLTCRGTHDMREQSRTTLHLGNVQEEQLLFWRRALGEKPGDCSFSRCLHKKVSEDNVEQLSSFPPQNEEKERETLPWRSGGIGHNTSRCQQKVPKTLGLEHYLEMGSPSLGSSSGGAQIKNRRVGGPRTGLKMWKKQLVLLHLRTSL